MPNCPLAWSAVLALGLCDAESACVYGVPPPDIAGYGEPLPWEGTSKDDWALLAPYVGTSFSIRSSGTVNPDGCCG